MYNKVHLELNILGYEMTSNGIELNIILFKYLHCRYFIINYII